MMPPRSLIVAPCGSRKRPHRAIARELYCGSYAHHCIEYAIALYASLDDAWPTILSAKHGFVNITTRLDPYDVTFGRPGAIDVDRLLVQAWHRGWLDCPDVRVVGGSRYVGMVQSVWPHAVPVIPAGLGMGQQMRWLKYHPPPLAAA